MKVQHEATIIMSVEVHQDGDEFHIAIPARNEAFLRAQYYDGLDDFIATLEYRGIGVQQIRSPFESMKGDS